MFFSRKKTPSRPVSVDGLRSSPDRGSLGERGGNTGEPAALRHSTFGHTDTVRERQPGGLGQRQKLLLGRFDLTAGLAAQTLHNLQVGLKTLPDSWK